MQFAELYDTFENELTTAQQVFLSPLVITGHSKITLYSASCFNLLLVNSRLKRTGTIYTPCQHQSEHGASIYSWYSDERPYVKSTGEALIEPDKSHPELMKIQPADPEGEQLSRDPMNIYTNSSETYPEACQEMSRLLQPYPAHQMIFLQNMLRFNPLLPII